MSNVRISKDHAKAMGLVVPKAAKKGMPKKEYVINWQAWGLPEPRKELQFCERKWRFDFAWHLGDIKIALEIDGGVWNQGRHLRGSGFIKDQQKRNHATLLGWRVFNCVPADIKSGSIFKILRQAMGLEAIAEARHPKVHAGCGAEEHRNFGDII